MGSSWCKKGALTKHVELKKFTIAGASHDCLNASFTQCGDFDGHPLYRPAGDDPDRPAVFYFREGSKWQLTQNFQKVEQDPSKKRLCTAYLTVKSGSVPLGEQTWQYSDGSSFEDRSLTVTAPDAKVQVGEVTMNPDSDNDIKIRWSDGTMSGYIKADCPSLSQASVAEQREAASWCEAGLGAKDSSGRIGTLTMAADSDAEVKLRWSDGTTSPYLKGLRVHPLSSAEQTDLKSSAASFVVKNAGKQGCNGT